MTRTIYNKTYFETFGKEDKFFSKITHNMLQGLVQREGEQMRSLPPGRWGSPTAVRYVQTREDSMIYRGLNVLVVLWFGSTPAPFLPSPLIKQDRRLTDRERETIAGGGGGGRGAESYDRKKAWSSTNHSILFGPNSFCEVLKFNTSWCVFDKKCLPH